MRRSARISKQPDSLSAKGSVAKESRYFEKSKDDTLVTPRGTTRTKKRPAQRIPNDASDSDRVEEEYAESDASDKPPRAKRRKVAARSTSSTTTTTASNKKKNGNAQLRYERLFGRTENDAAGIVRAISPPTKIGHLDRVHGLEYHRPLLLDSRQGRDALLAWFDAVSTARQMPWRKAWIDPTTIQNADRRRELLSRRAYEVWISEIMLQQTRVATVIDYWNRWMARWPTIEELSAAKAEEVTSAWRGLGYYGRSRRIYEAARFVCADDEMRGLLPENVETLVKKVAGVGRYTAGAVAAIVFGRAAPMVDGNVLRVLSRQMGVYGDVKADKAVIELIWAAADSLVKVVARDRPSGDEEKGDEEEEELRSDRPGRWGQALMEIGSTVCTPKPKCEVCPISASCRAYAEGLQRLTDKRSSRVSKALDIEDACTICKPFDVGLEVGKDGTELGSEEEEEEEATPDPNSEAPPSLPKQARLSSTDRDLIATYAQNFPLKVKKKAVREEEIVVCALRRSSDGRFLIHQRPAKGLLAGLWELPSHPLTDKPARKTAKGRKRVAETLVVEALLSREVRKRTRYVGELGSVPWLFSHLKLTMHVQLFEIDGEVDGEDVPATRKPFGATAIQDSRWSDAEGIEEESMGTGMRKCWALVKEAIRG